MSNLGKVAYDSFIREAGFAKDARIVEFGKLTTYMQARWLTVARDIIKAKEANDAKPKRRRAQGVSRRLSRTARH